MTTTARTDAERVIVIMGSGAKTVEEAVGHLSLKAKRWACVKVRLYRPFSVAHFLSALPHDQSHCGAGPHQGTGSLGEPLYTDVVTALFEGLAAGKTSFKSVPRMIGGRYGLSSKEFTPAMVKGVFDELKKPGRRTISRSASTTMSRTQACQ